MSQRININNKTCYGSAMINKGQVQRCEIFFKDPKSTKYGKTFEFKDGYWKVCETFRNNKTQMVTHWKGGQLNATYTGLTPDAQKIGINYEE